MELVSILVHISVLWACSSDGKVMILPTLVTKALIEVKALNTEMTFNFYGSSRIFLVHGLSPSMCSQDISCPTDLLWTISPLDGQWLVLFSEYRTKIYIEKEINERQMHNATIKTTRERKDLPRSEKDINHDWPPKILGNELPSGSLYRPKFSSRSRISLRALRDRRYGRGASVEGTEDTVVVVVERDGPCSRAAPGRGRRFCRTSYAASVKPNWGDDRTIRAGPPLKNARKPSCCQMVLAQWRRPWYLVSPFRASTCRRVLMTSHGVVRYAAGMPAMAPDKRSCTMPSCLVGDSPKKSVFKWE